MKMYFKMGLDKKLSRRYIKKYISLTISFIIYGYLAYVIPIPFAIVFWILLFAIMLEDMEIIIKE